jgi:hypothetical protein
MTAIMAAARLDGSGLVYTIGVTLGRNLARNDYYVRETRKCISVEVSSSAWSGVECIVVLPRCLRKWSSLKVTAGLFSPAVDWVSKPQTLLPAGPFL